MSKTQRENSLNVNSMISDLVVNGFNDKTLERIGGALVVAGTKKVIALIRGDDNASRVMSITGDAAGGAGSKAMTPILESISSLL